MDARHLEPGRLALAAALLAATATAATAQTTGTIQGVVVDADGTPLPGVTVTINDVRIATTIDGFPNGTSDYWSGAKANRFVDPMNLGGSAPLDDIRTGGQQTCSTSPTSPRSPRTRPGSGRRGPFR